MLELAWGAVTDTGRKRARNEDAYIAAPPIFAVADGMGGHSRGDVASALAMESLRSITEPNLSRTAVLESIRLAHDAITQVGQERTHDGMGTTICGLATTGESDASSLLVFNVGDSRVYRFEQGVLVQLTVDHSVVQELLDKGQISASDAATHPERHVVTRSLGSGGILDIDWWQLDPSAGDRFLLCSDGLVKELTPDQISATLAEAGAPQATADRLLEQALDAGGRDNITIVVIDVVRVTVDRQASGLDEDTNPRIELAGPTRDRSGSAP